MTFEEYEKVLKIENKELEYAKHNLKIIRHLTRFIKRNQQLMHFNLTQTNLTEYMLWKLGSALNRAKSLVSLHLSGNQGITPAL